jgi:prepilin-type N-terminal cleavage/methylation domain-containing protein
MKNNKKLSRGMTLVEVLVAMTIFAVMASAIFTVILHANKTANRAKMRDVELSAQTNIVGRNTFPVIAHADHLNPAAFDFNGYVGRAGIDRIFRELLYNGCRSLYNLTGGALVYCVLV